MREILQVIEALAVKETRKENKKDTTNITGMSKFISCSSPLMYLIV